MRITGLDKTFASWLPGDSPYIYSILLLGSLLMSTLISNTATSNLLIPIGVSLASGVMAEDSLFFTKQVAIGIALASSMAMSLPVSTAPNTIAYAQGKLSTIDFVKTGSIIGIIAVVFISLGAWLVHWISMNYL
jgi:solute carrier family 13 (sodium-dependent dicarboxylate transporter), member 2/3/5